MSPLFVGSLGNFLGFPFLIAFPRRQEVGLRKANAWSRSPGLFLSVTSVSAKNHNSSQKATTGFIHS